MEFLVQIQVNFPPEMPAEQIAEVLERELVRGRELQDAGTIVRIWRVVGRRANVAIWQADDGDTLHETISTLPAFPWIDARVTPLATHPIEAPR
jgi:muconolactone D-isomerase